MNRREFVKTSSQALAFAAVAGISWAQGGRVLAQGTPKRSLKKAIHLDMISGNQSVMDKFKLAKDLGFNGLEVGGPNDARKSDILKARDATGIQIASLMNGVHWGSPMSDPDAAVREKGLVALKQCLRDCKEYGCTSVLLVPAVVNAKVSYADAYQRSQAEIKKAIPLAEELGVQIAIENVWNQFLLSPLEAARYVDEFNSPAVKWHFDVGNIINYGWPEQWIRILGKRIAKVHVKEFSRAKRDKEGLWAGFNAELLEGDNNWPAVMKAFDEVGYNGWMIAEIGGGDETRLKDIATRMDKINAS